MDVKLSIVILNYNTKELLIRCLLSLIPLIEEVNFEVIVIDNGSSDGSVAAVSGLGFSKSRFKVIENKKNLGFAKGNNAARNVVRGKYILFLNSDTEVRKGTLVETYKYMEKNAGVGALSCRVELPSGRLDPDTRRSFPTPWVALTHFSYLDRFMPRSKLFARYWYGYLDPGVTHEVDCIQGAFFLVRKRVLDEVGWFDESYFLDGEDIDLCWKIKAAGYKIFYYPKVSILHIKKASKKKRKKSVFEGVASMEIFYRKRLWNRYPWLVNYLVVVAIRLLSLLRGYVFMLK